MLDDNQIIKLVEQSGIDTRGREIDADATFSDLGIDSLDVFNLVAQVEIQYGVHVPDADFAKLKTLNDIRDYVQQRVNA